jgi:hypothetical protein
MATLSDTFTPIMKGLLKTYETLTHTELKEVAWLMSLYVTGIEEQSDLTIKTEAGFQAAIELFAKSDKVDFITYEENKNNGRLDGTYRYSIFQWRRLEEAKYQIVVEHHWSYHDEGFFIEEVDHDYYSPAKWKKRVLEIQALTESYSPAF